MPFSSTFSSKALALRHKLIFHSSLRTPSETAYHPVLYPPFLTVLFFLSLFTVFIAFTLSFFMPHVTAGICHGDGMHFSYSCHDFRMT